jgi:hypothetical protein
LSAAIQDLRRQINDLTTPEGSGFQWERMGNISTSNYLAHQSPTGHEVSHIVSPERLLTEESPS